MEFGQVPKAGRQGRAGGGRTEAGQTGNIFINNNLFCVINNVGIVCFRCARGNRRHRQGQGGRKRRRRRRRHRVRDEAAVAAAWA